MNFNNPAQQISNTSGSDKIQIMWSQRLQTWPLAWQGICHYLQ